MRGTKTIEFETPFRYSANGVYSETTTVTIRAPGLGKFDVHNKMQAYVMEAMFALAKQAAEMRGFAEAKKAAAEDDDEAPKDQPDPPGSEIMDQISAGLGHTKYPEFAGYVKRVLTNTPKLATVGEDKQPLTDEVWEAIEETNGTSAAMDILGGFAGFFVNALGSKKTTGSALSATSSSPMKVASPMSMPPRSRVKN